MDLKNYISDVPDFPKEGIIFKDISPLLASPEATGHALELLSKGLHDIKATKVVGIESRGFLFGTLLAQQLGLGFVPVRKPGKLPGNVLRESYALEYGTDHIEIQADRIKQGELVIVHDDILATGGTASAACRLIERCGGKVVQCNFLMELGFLNGREKLKNYALHSLMHI
ncbi:MAG: adenine phosphoribosyltransferase [Leeuwenhoekiella sp.]|uniref:Adenine phosphoribosyltransferase n=1 Tax=Leeuwenhoekiella nanhaiensis TaxID=1655491 RepID=A0A2G1VS11_9FLAO|nr:adenine phosphoribosyltransferase [Leeuwenhoekiella nanhaiensis]PHQ29556.1 adenine phosphoribosyltransferase [Leeuwenhoekiella nanhaiensis]PHR89721.1 MAG: adenine phosphoribosyltransferase [Leeuwenhoekiella sp.]